MSSFAHSRFFLEDYQSRLVYFATKYVQEGKFEKAEEICSEILMKEPNHFDALHLLGILYAQKGKSELAVGCLKAALRQKQTPDAFLNLGLVYDQLKDHQDALTCFRYVLMLSPDDERAQGHFLESLEKNLSNKTSKNSKLIFGMGTGRSGSTSLTMLLRGQKDCYAAHESPPRMPWKEGLGRFNFHKKRLERLLKSHSFVAEVSHWWLKYFDQIVQWNPDVRAVILKRKKEDTIESFLKIKGEGKKGTINHWTDHDGSYFQQNLWDECYPSYRTKDIKEAIGKYWDEYYREGEALCQKYPKNIRIFHTEDLNDEKMQSAILQFLGFEEPATYQNLHYNKKSVSDGLNLY